MSNRRLIRLALFAVLAVVVVFALSDVLGLRASDTSVVSPKGYVGISHGSHTHYVPNGWDGSTSISDFPTSPPPEGMTVAEDGRIVPVE
ncbi:hypothetical protein [Rubrivirga marina]|uniref:Uncharacterized protein n=1 Tax=Rubrivirga marina TaxID=1196024 RepID=A0A271J277_9BACT|nr:hypothetical protein [Rubrivirga marina]PAP77553.1 hypothetical protein BSZ37_14435 [Rubrivirga marina]